MDSKQEQLKQKAKEFESLLQQYAKQDDDVEDFLRRMNPWFLKIQNGEITIPNYEWKLPIYFFNPDVSPLADRYMGTELGEMCAQFSLLIGGLR